MSVVIANTIMVLRLKSSSRLPVLSFLSLVRVLLVEN
jgi:hypothetical protein